MSLLEAKKQIELRILNGSPQPNPSPTALSLAQIETIPEAFQHRSGNQASSDSHVKELLKNLKASKGQAFEAITVFWVGDAWVVIDGHHRYWAYSASFYQQPIPVRVFSGTLDEALGEALKGNSRDKLSMSRSEKSNACWRIVVSTALSIKKTMDASGRSKPTVIAMRDAKKKIQKLRPEVDLGELSWMDAMLMAKGLEPKVFEHDDDWLEAKAQTLADRLVKAFGMTLGAQPEVFCRAIEIYDCQLSSYLIERLGLNPETMEPYDLEEQVAYSEFMGPPEPEPF